jgi:aspartate-semialdehyde dehydrogenase
MTEQKKGYTLCVLGATGLVGETIIRVLQERDFPVSELFPLASNRSVGKRVEFRGRHLPVIMKAGRFHKNRLH